jgi:glucosyl-3-phosphoglycerate synthase
LTPGPEHSAPHSAAHWYQHRTFDSADWTLDQLVATKGDQRISVVIPARNEAATIGPIVAGIRTDLIDTHPLLDEVVVIDSDSTDATAQIAADAGATVHAAADIRPDLGRHRGKGEALWKSQFVTTGDLLVFIDADLTGWGTHFVSGLLGPLLSNPDIQLVKGFYDRILDDGTRRLAPQGGRVTELVARPLLNLHWPDLSRVVQPLAGEWAIRRNAFTALSVPVGYGVEIGALLDIHRTHGLDAIAQVDLGHRKHTHQSVHDLAVMAAEIITVTHRRTGSPPPTAHQLWQYDRTTGWTDRDIPITERPPADTVATPPSPPANLQ